MTDRYSSRTFGTIVHVIDVEKASAFLKDKLGTDLEIQAERMAVVNGEKGLATVMNEGVGWYADSEGVLPINYWSGNSSGYLDITPEELATLISDETVDLADHVRVFGDRLETNLYIWQNYAKGYPQDKMSLATYTLVA
jgi:hypothetical protein